MPGGGEGEVGHRQPAPCKPPAGIRAGPLAFNRVTATHMTKPNQGQINRVSWFESKLFRWNILESNAGGGGVPPLPHPLTASFPVRARIQKGLQDEHRRHLVDD